MSARDWLAPTVLLISKGLWALDASFLDMTEKVSMLMSFFIASSASDELAPSGIIFDAGGGVLLLSSKLARALMLKRAGAAAGSAGVGGAISGTGAGEANPG
jgi:hypothetical protein